MCERASLDFILSASAGVLMVHEIEETGERMEGELEGKGGGGGMWMKARVVGAASLSALYVFLSRPCCRAHFMCHLRTKEFSKSSVLFEMRGFYPAIKHIQKNTLQAREIGKAQQCPMAQPEGLACKLFEGEC